MQFFDLKGVGFVFGLICCLQSLTAQTLTLSDFLKQVIEYHPVVAQSYARNDAALGKLLKARGGLDPKINFDKQDKQFGGKDYFRENQLAFKVPTGLGLDFKAFYQQNAGDFLNPAQKTPKKGLYGLGINVPLARGLLTNERLNTIRKAKLFQKQRLAMQQLEINALLYDAINVYIDWLLSHRQLGVRKRGLKNAERRLNNVRTNFKNGDKAAIDTLEAYVFYNGQLLAHQKADLARTKAAIALSNFLWGADQIPLVFAKGTVPDNNTLSSVAPLLKLDQVNWIQVLDAHPKLQSLDLKYQMADLDRRLYRNQLLPKVDLQYNWLSEDRTRFSSFSNQQYKFGLTVSVPLLMRKARGGLKASKNKMRDLSLDQSRLKNVLSNEVLLLQTSLTAYRTQLKTARETAVAYGRLTRGEERKMLLGDSNLFTVNYRNAKAIEAALKWMEVENKMLKTYAKLFKLKADSQF